MGALEPKVIRCIRIKPISGISVKSKGFDLFFATIGRVEKVVGSALPPLA